MADYHILGDGVYGVGTGGMMEESPGMVNPGSYSHATSVNASGPAMIPQNMTGTPTQNPSALMQGMVSHQQVHQAQTGSQIAPGGMGAYHQAAVHTYSQSEVPQKLHQYSGYGSQLPTGNIGGQYVSGPRLHHLGDSLVPSGSQQPPQQQQAPPRTVMPNQITYQNRNMSGNHYGQQIPHNSTPSAQLSQTATQYTNQYGSVNHHQLPQHSVQQNSQSADMWQSPVGHTQVTRPCMSQTQAYSHQVSIMPSQHGNSALTHGSLQMQGPRPSTPNQSQYVGGQDYGVQHASAQPSTMQRQPTYNLNTTSINQNGTVMAQVTGTPQSGMSQSVASLQQTEQVMSFPQGPYSGTSQAGVSRPHYNTVSSAVPAVASPTQPHIIGQQIMNMRPMHQMGYSPVSSRVNSGQQHSGTLPPGSPARLQQYHPPFSPNTSYSSTTQPSPHHGTGETATPPHISLYPSSQSVSQAPTSPQYRNPFPSQVTQSPQHLTPTPPAESPMSQNCHTPDRGIHSSTPQSQGSFSSPTATHMTSPGHGHSPGNSNAPSNSLQHLEQMVLPRMGSGPSTPTANNVSPGTPNTMISHTSGVGGPYYGHLTPQNTQTPHHPHHSSAVGDNRPQPQSPAFSHVSSQPHPAYVGQASMPIGQVSPSVSNVPNSQSMQTSSASVNTLCNPNASVDERNLQDPGPHNTNMTYPSVSKTNVMQGIVGSEMKNSTLPTGPPSSGLISSMSNVTSQNHLSSVSSSTSGTGPVCSNAYVVGKTTYQQGPSVAYEVQQIQQELQQLYVMPQNPECQEKAKELQERLVFLQSQSSQKSTVPPIQPNVTNQPIPTPYPRSPMLFNPGNPSAYLHQQPMQPHTVHYNPQAQQPSLKQETSHGNSHNDFVIQEMNSSHSNSMCAISEQDPVDNVNIQQLAFSTPSDAVMPLQQVEKSDLSIDPYELNFNEDPPVKMKRRTPKSEPKEPKPKKTSKPKKSKKSKIDEVTLANVVLGAELLPESNAEENIENQESATPKKSKKRKAKDKDDKDPTEPKEPKPKKQRKKSPKQPKKSKEEKELKVQGETYNDDNNNENNQNDAEETPAVENSTEVSEGNQEGTGKELKDNKKKDVKDKKESKSKNSKSASSSKESKSKSSPKKKLPKIALKFTSKKKKKKRLGASSDNNSDMEKTPPPSPTERDGIQKRRSARNTMRKKYTDDIDLHLTDDETIEMDFDQSAVNLDGKAVQVVLDNHTEDYMVVEKILAVRVSKKQPENANISDAENSSAAPEPYDVEEYYVKYKNLSYIHCEWRSLEELEKGDRRFMQKVKRFKQKKDTINFFDFLEEEPFNPDYVEVDRVLDVNEIREVIDIEGKGTNSPEVKISTSSEMKISSSSEVEKVVDSSQEQTELSEVKFSDSSTENVIDSVAGKASDACVGNIFDSSGVRVTNSSEVRVTDSSEVRVTDSSEVKVTDSSEVKVTDSSEVRVTDSSEVRVTDSSEVRVADSSEVRVADSSEVRVTDSSEVKVAGSFEENKIPISNRSVMLSTDNLSDKPVSSHSTNQIHASELYREKYQPDGKEKDLDSEQDSSLLHEAQEVTKEKQNSILQIEDMDVMCETDSTVVKTSVDIEASENVPRAEILHNVSKQIDTESASEIEKEHEKLETLSTIKAKITGECVKNVKITRHYLVKWRALTYEESTWELEDDVDRTKIEQFEKFKDPPPKEKWKTKKRPKYSEWNQIENSPVYKGGNTLREYQLEGVNWLTFCWYNVQNCILADEMGLGKTIQSITFFNEIDKYGIPGPFLVIAPLSTIGNWQREFETWTDLNTITYHGSSSSRNMIQEYEMYWKNEKGERIQEVYKFQVMITTFEVILTDCLELKSVPWRCVVIDEAHRLKNRNCKLLEGLRLLETEHRVLLTGTPLQNNVEELFSLLNFLEPNRFASTEAFLEEFGDLKTEAQVDKLKALLKPMMLRRLKEDVEKTLAPKEETVIEVELTNIQKKYYRAILERNFSFLTKGGSYSNMPNLMNTMMELRKCCIHPFLINGAEEQIIYDYKNMHEDGLEVLLNAMVQASGKLVLIDKLLPRLRANGHRVLVFSQMVRCLDILEDYMVQKRYPYERIDGRVRGNMRQAAIDRFCKPDSDRFVFLLCTRAGGLGINLTAADTVIIFDSDWNPQNDLQAQARCHRIGQSKAVKVYRLICRNTYEREMFDKASLKLGLDKAVLQSISAPKETAGLNQQMSKKEIEDLLRKGAYGALMDDDNAGDKFCEEDIDQILQRRTQVIQLESGTKGSTFSKASFASSSTRSDIEIDDPNFWEKWAKKANFDVDELQNRNDLIIQEPRRRTQTRRFGTDDHMLDLSELDTSDEDDESVSTRTRASRRTSKGSSRSKGKNRGRALDREREEEMMEAIAPGNWTRAECYKVEKGLLTFGWGRWDACIALGHFRRHLTHKDIEDISRIILLYCLLHYRGDEKIKGFIWDLISPSDDGEERIHRNHSECEFTNDKEGVFEVLSTDGEGLSAPVPRGRKGKKFKKDMKSGSPYSDEGFEWARDEKYNPELLLSDDSYKRHLNRHANRVLLRVRLLYYLKHEVIGDLHYQVFSGIPASEIPLQEPTADGEPPALWWDQEADKSLLIGIYKHGFERYNVMRQDPTLCFLARCGPPDGAALLAELNINDDDLEDQSLQKETIDKEDGKYDKYMDDLEALSPASETSTSKTNSQENSLPAALVMPQFFDTSMEMGMLQFPSVTDLNTRLRRIVTAYQRTNKKQEQRMAQKARKIERREKFEAAIRERELKKRELQQRKWSRREEADFYRTISSFGVEYNKDKTDFNWTRFRSIARLERKFDETLAEYFRAFYAMCKRVCGRKLTEDEEQLPLIVEPISEERASRCLQRIDLLSKIREEILFNPELDERLKLCQSSMDLPDWWQCGKHDKDLLIGAARHGLSRMDYHLLHDSDLSFKDVLKNFPNAKNIHICSHVSTPVGCSSPITTCQSTDENVVAKEEVPVSDSISNTTLQPLIENQDEKKVLPSVDNKEDKNIIEMEKNQEHKATVKNEEIIVEKPVIETVAETEEDQHTESLKKESGEIISDELKDENDNKPVQEPMESCEKLSTEYVEIKSEPPGNDKVEAKVETQKDELKVENENDEETDIEMDLTKDDELKINALDQSKDVIQMELDPEGKDDIEMKVNPETDTEEKPNMQSKENIKPEVRESTQLEHKDLKGEILENLKPALPNEEDNKSCVLPGLSALIIPKDIKESPLRLGIDDSQECVSQNDDLTSQASFNLEHELGEPTVAQLLAITSGNSVRWPKDKVLQIRLEHVVHAVEKNEWPVIRHTFLPTFPVVGTSASGLTNAVLTASPSSHRASPVPSVSSQGHSGEATPQATPEHTPQREPILPDIQVPPPDFGILSKNPIQPLLQANDPIKHRRRRRRRRFEIEAERAKLRALLSHNMQQQQHHHQQQIQHVQQFLASSNPSLLRPKLWEDHSEEKTPVPTAPSPVSLVTSAATNVPPPAHQNSSPRVATTIGSLDLRVKCSITPPSPFTPTAVTQKPKPSLIEQLGGVSGSPSSPMDLSSTCGGPPTSSSKSSNPNTALNHAMSSSAMDTSALKAQTKNKPRERGGAKGGSRIDALALNLQARKQKQMLQEQHHHRPTDIGSLLAERAEKNKEIDPKSDEFSHHHQYHHHDRRNVEEEEVKLRKKRYNEESLRKTASRAFDMTPAPAHSSFMNPSTPTNLGRLLSGSKSDDTSVGSNPILDHSSLMHHDFKKWLEDHPELVATNPNLVAAAAAAMAFSPVPSFPSHTELLELPEGRRRGRRPRLDPTKLDFDKITGEENVSVINRLTGKKITGSKAPPLKHLAEWLDKNPMFDVDPKWGPLVREKGNLPGNMTKRIITPSEKRGRRTAASLLASAHQNLVSPPTTMAFPSAAGLNPLSFANAGMLTGFPNMKFFMDSAKANSASTPTTSAGPTSASTPPIFLPFGGLAGMGLTNPLFGFPGFNFQGLQGTPSIGGVSASSSSKDHGKDGDKSKAEKNTEGSSNSTSRSKNVPVSSGSASSNISSTTSMPSATSLPFLYPAPGLLYNPLGLGGFTLPPNLPASFASLTQSGLVNGLGLSNPLVTTSSMGSTPSSLASALTTTVSAMSYGSTATPSVSKSMSNIASNKHTLSQSVMEGQDSDDESLKSLMGNHDDDDDDFEDGKLEIDNLDRDDSDRESNKDSIRESPMFIASRTSAKAVDSESETLNLVKANSLRPSVELKTNKSKSVSDDPTSDNTDTESKHS